MTDEKKRGRPSTRVDGKHVCYWLPTATIEKINAIAEALGIANGAAVIAAVDAYEADAETTKKLKKLEKIKKILLDQ